MQQRPLLSAALLLANVAGTMAQSSSIRPLNAFLGDVNSAAAAINSVNAKATPAPSSSSSASPTQAAATSPALAAAAKQSGINRTTLIVAIVCAIIGALLIALLVGLCCWCLARRRRRRRDQSHVPIDEEVKTWRSNEPKNPGRDYSPHRNSNSHVTSMEQQPMIPPVAKTPDMQQHPALRNNNAENPFVPVPPSPRRQAPNSRAGLTDGTVPGAAPFIMPAAQKSRSRSSSRPRANSTPKGLPTANTNSSPSTPFGLQGIGQPYEDMHVHVLQTDHPSHELRQSLINREPVISPPAEPINRYDTPPTAISRSPNRTNNPAATNSVAGETSSTEGSTSADDWRYTKGSTTFNNTPPWEQRKHRYSNSPSGSTGNAYNMIAPPIPWEERQAKYDSPSHSPRQSRDFPQSGSGTGTAGYVEGARRNSRSPATSINGQPRRLRFSDLQAEDMRQGNYRHSQGVGEAL